jgi:hypothetical protein
MVLVGAELTLKTAIPASAITEPDWISALLAFSAAFRLAEKTPNAL